MNKEKEREAFVLTTLSKRCQSCGGRMVLTTEDIIHERNSSSQCPNANNEE